MQKIADPIGKRKTETTLAAKTDLVLYVQARFTASSRAIWLAAVVAAFHDPTLSAFYQKKRAEGKHHNTAIGAVARKLTLIIYAVLRDNKPYAPAE